MELVFHGCRSKDNVHWCSWIEEDRECTEADSREGKAATLQWPRGDEDCGEAFSRCALYGRFGTLSPYPAKLLSGWRRDAAGFSAQRRMGQRLTLFASANGSVLGLADWVLIRFTFPKLLSGDLDADLCGVGQCSAHIFLPAWPRKWGSELPWPVSVSLSWFHNAEVPACRLVNSDQSTRKYWLASTFFCPVRLTLLRLDSRTNRV